ncbi:MAG: hypothetical protein ACYCUM_12300 [Solirubrobacteraceae bacterium]
MQHLGKLERHFAIFRHSMSLQRPSAQAASAASDASLVAKFRSSEAARPAFDPGSAVTMQVGEYPVVVLAGEERVALYNGEAGTRVGMTPHEAGSVLSGASSTRAEAEEDGLWGIGASYTGGQIEDVGLVPNGNSSVTVTESNGTTKVVPVTANVVALTGLRTGVAPVAVMYKNGKGETMTETLPMPGPPPAPSAPGE